MEKTAFLNSSSAIGSWATCKSPLTMAHAMGAIVSQQVRGRMTRLVARRRHTSACDISTTARRNGRAGGLAGVLGAGNRMRNCARVLRDDLVVSRGDVEHDAVTL